MSAVAQLEAGLNAMLNLKPPGVTGSYIKNLTALCVDNVQSESVLIQKIYTHFKKTPGTHKLGVLYVVDSVTRRWIDMAKQQGQAINSSAPDGTFAAGVHRVTELLPVLMNDILQSAPKEQKEKLRKLVDIWEKGQSFPLSMIETFKQKLNSPEIKNVSTTPVGSPPPGPGLPGLPGSNGMVEAKAPTTEAPNAIMEALANIARQNITAPTSSAALPARDNAYSIANPQNDPAHQQQQPMPVSQSQPGYSYPAAPAPVNAPALVPAMPYAYPLQVSVPAQAPTMPVTASSQANGFPAAGVDPGFAQQVQLIKLLLDQGIPQAQIPALLATMQAATPASAPPIAAHSLVPPQNQNPYGGSAWGQGPSRPDESRDRQDLHNSVRSPNRYRTRSRSRSPPRHWDSRDSSHRRNDRGPGLGHFSHDSPGRGRMDEQDRRGRPDYRQRSPPGRRGRSPSPRYDRPVPGQKWIDFDRSIGSGNIKVLSRTLFVGGVTCPESELRNMFGQHGQVQTCIVNKDKRHAFVKMINRRDAVAAKEAMENSQFRTRWGVGFGPRDCSDYSTGISVIPISKLTDADRKWMLTAEFGGSGGRAIESGMVVEEPDIEIGAGVSSKAISRRMQTDKGGRQGPRSSRGGDDNEGGNLTRWRRNKENRRDDRRDDRGPGNDHQPAVPDFGFGLAAGANGMPVFPPGFSFPAPH
ncbi:uncharacterized protein BCR38DRAFT_205502 [Pseudomassariella vexata]|uniref:RNA binding protein Nrd1 n=1 Tax=Pseudomassariella vexata TaxID=1141098 RepID=A0A1Y2DXQ4_9PEZI|nr:uncharacterized protein BCR38DRAFT_205502 [Pseudomassariella vexata]ORY64051.1 hypothetical protein BCR38DRAFT_205502 [Pseudomassariella vexata]